MSEKRAYYYEYTTDSIDHWIPTVDLIDPKDGPDTDKMGETEWRNRIVLTPE